MRAIEPVDSLPLGENDSREAPPERSEVVHVSEYVTGRNIISLQRSSIAMTQSASPDNSDMVSIRVSRATQEKLKKLKKGKMTYDDVISQMVDDENWDVEKLDADLDLIEKKSKFYSFEEVFEGV
jgi:DNA topoisomerase IA